MSKFTVVGQIKPADYKDPVLMLRNLADNIEAGLYGEVETIVAATAGSAGYHTFGGGADCGMHACAFLFSASAARLHTIPFDGAD